MSESKNYDVKDSRTDLKSADSEKHDSREGSTQSSVSEVLEEKIKKKISATERKRNANKRKLPVIVDVIVGVLVIAISIGIVAGAFILFRYYSDDYGNEKVEYTVVAHCYGDQSLYRTMKNKELYMDTEDNTLYFGKIASVDLIENAEGENTLLLTVRATVKYKKGTGYSVGDNRIAVGSEYTLRSENISIEGTVIELTRMSEIGGK